MLTLLTTICQCHLSLTIIMFIIYFNLLLKVIGIKMAAKHSPEDSKSPNRPESTSLERQLSEGAESPSREIGQASFKESSRSPRRPFEASGSLGPLVDTRWSEGSRSPHEAYRPHVHPRRLQESSRSPIKARASEGSRPYKDQKFFSEESKEFLELKLRPEGYIFPQRSPTSTEKKAYEELKSSPVIVETVPKTWRSSTPTPVSPKIKHRSPMALINLGTEEYELPLDTQASIRSTEFSQEVKPLSMSPKTSHNSPRPFSGLTSEESILPIDTPASLISYESCLNAQPSAGISRPFFQAQSCLESASRRCSESAGLTTVETKSVDSPSYTKPRVSSGSFGSSTVDCAVGPFPEHSQGTQRNIERKVFIGIGPLLVDGAFGKIRLAMYDGRTVILKAVEGKKNVEQLKYEYGILKDLQPVKGVPTLYGYGYINFREQFVVMERLGCTLTELQTLCGGKFSDNTVANIAIKVVKILKDIHGRSIVHGDLSPSNIMVGFRKHREHFYLIDFEKSVKYELPTEHRRPTSRSIYKSINAHEGYYLRPDDDIESLGYILLRMSKGSLPWEAELEQGDEDTDKKIQRTKKFLGIAQLTEGAPDVFVEYFHHVFINRALRKRVKDSELRMSTKKFGDLSTSQSSKFDISEDTYTHAVASVGIQKDEYSNPIVNYEFLDSIFTLLHLKTRVLSADERIRWDWEYKLKQHEYTGLETIKPSGPYHFEEYNDVDNHQTE